MPIPSSILGAPRLPEVGHLKLGGKGEARQSQKGGSYNLPVKYESWVITSRRRDGVNLVPDAGLMEALETYNAQYEDHEEGKPKRIPIFLPYNDPNMNFMTYLGMYAGKRPACVNMKGGEEAMRSFKGQQECEPYPVKCVCPLLDEGKCKWHGTLRVMLRLPGTSMGGFFTYRTTSKNSIRNITGGMARFAYETGGVLAGLPLELVCDKQTVRTPQDQDMNAMIVRLDFPGDPDQFMKKVIEVREEQLKRRQILGHIGVAEKKLLIGFSEADEQENAADINEEFQPETAGKTAVQVMRDDPPVGEAQQTSTRKPRGRKKAEEPAQKEPPVQDASFAPPAGAEEAPGDEAPEGEDLSKLFQA